MNFRNGYEFMEIDIFFEDKILLFKKRVKRIDLELLPVVR